MLTTTSSVVVTRALGLLPDGIPSETETTCALCGLHVNPGDLVAPLSLNPSFMDDLTMACRGSAHICGYCVPLMSQQGLIQTGYGAFGENGVLPFRKWADIKQALLCPPDPPFVLVYATSKNQHMAWRAPVNHSKDSYRVRVGLRDLLVRRAVLEKAVHNCKILSPRDQGNKKTLPNPFLMLSPDLKDITHGQLKKLSKDATPEQEKAYKFMQNLTLGETWALRFVLTSTVSED